MGFDTHEEARTSHGVAGERLQLLYGFMVETYARHGNEMGATKGAMMSPVALQRIPESSFETALDVNQAEGAMANPDAVFAHLLRGCGIISKTKFLRDASINEIVREYLRYHDWGDSSRIKKETHEK